jgi:hypothetical protein
MNLTVKAFAAAVVLTTPIIAGAGSPSIVLSGRVTEGSGVDPVAGAVVSLELLTDGTTAKGNKLPTRLAVWQVRTGADGSFALPVKADSLALPPSSKLSGARLKVFALTYAPYESRGIKLNTQSLGQGRVRILPSGSDLKIYLTSQREDDPWITAQLDAMYNEVRQGTRIDVGPSGQQQAVASYEPLLNLLAMSCFQIETLSGRSPVPCQKASKEFDLRGAFPAEVNFVQMEPVAPAPPQSKPATPMVIRGSGPDAPTEGSIKQPPPGD